MNSPSRQRLAILMKGKAEADPIYKPLQGLPKAQMFVVQKFSYKQSNYGADSKNPDSPKPFNLIADLMHAYTYMYTYLPKEYASLEEDNIKTTVDLFNKDIDSVVMKFAYYGVLDSQAKVLIHFDDEGIDDKLLAGVQLWGKKKP